MTLPFRTKSIRLLDDTTLAVTEAESGAVYWAALPVKRALLDEGVVPLGGREGRQLTEAEAARVMGWDWMDAAGEPRHADDVVTDPLVLWTARRAWADELLGYRGVVELPTWDEAVAELKSGRNGWPVPSYLEG